jgi:hypothetical protein
MERRSIILRSLVAGRQYAVSVQAGNDGGWGRMSAVAEGVPAGPRAAAPGRLRIAQVSGQRVRVTWQASKDATRYEVQRRRVGSGWVRAAWTTRTSATTDRLRAGRRWTFRVQAWHQLVPGGRSGTLSLTMRPD